MPDDSQAQAAPEPLHTPVVSEEITETQGQEKIFALLGDVAESAPDQPPSPEAPPTEAKADAESTRDQPPPQPEAKVEETPQPEPLVEVDYEGRRYNVPSELRDALMRNRDYTVKTQELAELRRAAQAQNEAAARERTAYAQGLQAAQVMLETKLTELGAPDARLAETDPTRYNAQVAQRHALSEEYAKVMQSRQALALQDAAQRNQAFQAQVENQLAQVLDRLPAWRDPGTRSQEQAAIAQYLLSSGYEKHELSPQYDANGFLLTPGLADARALLLARKAMLYDQVTSQKEARVDLASKRVENLPKRVTVPGTAREQPSREQEAVARLRRSGSIDDAAEAVYSRLFGGNN